MYCEVTASTRQFRSNPTTRKEKQKLDDILRDFFIPLNRLSNRFSIFSNVIEPIMLDTVENL